MTIKTKRSLKKRPRRPAERRSKIREASSRYGQPRVTADLPREKTFRLIDAFSGAGGMTLGFTESSGTRFIPVWANDFNEHCVSTYNANFGSHCLGGDVAALLEDPRTKIPKADVVVGGPPCQGFSLLNRNREGDPRKQLWRPYFEIVRRSGATVFVMENVPQLIGSPEYFEIKGMAEGMGFKVHSEILCAADYGVPQTRRRAIIIGSKRVDPKAALPPPRTHFNAARGFQPSLDASEDVYSRAAQPWLTVKDAIADLPPPEGTDIRQVEPPLNLHFGRSPTAVSIARYRAIPNEGMNRFDLQKRAPELTPGCWLRKKSGGTDLFGRLWWNRPAFTIRTEFFKPEKGRYLHPQQHRPITHREAARLQSFPDHFIFKGTKIQVALQIGNAVPPRLAARIADVVRHLLTVSDQ